MRFYSPLVLSAAMLTVGLPALAAQQQGNSPEPHATIAPPSAAKNTAAAPTWTEDQLLTSTVHQAWLMSGKNEATFFEVVTQLAEMSAKNRNLELPETAAAGRRVGEMIKVAAKQDTDQLLYAVVDSAVRKVGKPTDATAGQQ